MELSARHERALVAALIASLLLWNLPLGGVVLYPFKLLVTWLHEMSHGLVMLATGAGFSHLEIFRDTSGIAYAQNGVSAAGRAAIASAGYTGAALLGAVLLVLAQSARNARRVLLGLAAALLISLLFWVRNDFGIAAVSIAAGVCLLAARFASEDIALLVVNFIAAQACINAVLDIRVLFRSQQHLRQPSALGWRLARLLVPLLLRRPAPDPPAPASRRPGRASRPHAPYFLTGEEAGAGSTASQAASSGAAGSRSDRSLQESASRWKWL
jgi:hypothetical protein